jgi:hypothetical protein
MDILVDIYWRRVLKMRQTETSKIPFTTAYVAQCMCSKCPVQKMSKCAKDLLVNMGTTVCKEKTPLNREEIPGLYCSTGTASCGDIDTKQACICGTCAVFSSFKLADKMPVGHFCRDGSSH